MYGLVGFILFFALAFWGTFITHKSRMHRIQNKMLRNKHKHYISIIKKINEIYGKE